jgi:subtilisin family serine protease
LALEKLEDRTVFSAAFAPNELLVQYAPIGASIAADSVRSALGATLLQSIQTAAMIESGDGVLERIKLPTGMSVESAARLASLLPGVLYAEPNYVVSPSYVSNDTYYTSGQLWGMYSDDLPTAVGPAGTTNQYGSQAEKAWNAGYIGSNSVYVGVIDEGFQFSHPDLDGNSWTNPYAPVDGIDNDGNGRIDDIHGWDFFNNDNTTYDGVDDDHGTHVAGTIGGEGGNGSGVAGVNWNVTMISAKFLGPSGGYTSSAIAALDYLTDLKQRHGLKIVATNNSWGGGGYSAGLHSAIIRSAKAGILFIAAAGNAGTNNDSGAFYPANYSTLVGTATETAASYESVIAVASITNTGARSSFSSYGATTVDIGAPGSGIISTVPTNSYALYSGTSMATPHVTGAAALYASVYPNATAEQIRNAILTSATPTASLAGITVTGGRLNVYGALQIPPGIGMSINDVSATEGNSGTKNFTFTVTLTGSSASTITVDFATADGTATAASGDYASNNGTLTFAPGETSKAITVLVNGDTAVENDETFLVNLTNASGANITDGQGQGTIINNDTPPASLSINDISFNERNSGSTTRSFTVTLSQALATSVTVSYSTADGTATAGSDYQAKSGTVTFSAGVTSRTIGIRVYGDRTVEANETFFVNLSNAVGATISDGQGQATILNDDGSGGAGGGDEGGAGGPAGSGGSGSTLLWRYLNAGYDVVQEQSMHGTALNITGRGKRIRIIV